MRTALISGGGIAGSTAAYWLAKAGFAVTVVEQAAGTRSSGSPVDVRGPAVDVAERMGVMGRIRDADTRVRDMVFINARGRVVSRVDMRATWAAPDDAELPRGVLAAILRAAVPDGVEFQFGNCVTALGQDADGVTAEFADGPTRRFDVVLGADGAYSAVRLRLQITPNADLHFLPHGYKELTIPARDGEFGLDPGSLHIWPRGASMMIALPNTDRSFTCTLFWAKDEFAALDTPERVLAAFRERYPDAVPLMPTLAADYLANPVGSLVTVRCRPWVRGRVALVGDAAACVSLLAGEGTGLAMVEAYVLAGELQRACGDFGQAFKAYETRLQPFIEDKQNRASSFVSFFVARTWPGIWLRNVGLQAMNIPIVGDLALNRTLRDDIELPDYAI